ncbi:tectonic-3 isoform X2 [Salarias fasciatus]|uniref:tectonic-3 isoform X2 n=1 Tax=Salarias fasciatus TaxID=181472 RepID=UPI001176620D|nr:tectonic-3 isoform X2 [Salarias fasciatus]
MISRPWCPLVLLLIVSSGGLAHAATDSGINSTDEAFGSATPAPGGTAQTVDPTGVTATEEVTPDPGLLNSTVNGTLSPAEETTVDTEAPTEAATTVPPAVTPPQGCSCDLTPDFCDIGCCCDTVDCAVANLSTVFTGCPPQAISGVCVEKWLMFRANVDSSLVTVTDSLFCVQPEDDAVQSVPAVAQFPSLGSSYHFSPPEPTSTNHSFNFYRADDVMQTYFSNSSVRGLLRQPSPRAAASLCVNRNPAKFLRSESLSCTRMVTSESCTTDPTLNARSYSSDISLVKIPRGERDPVSDFLVPVTPLADWPAPSLQNNSCVNAVAEVEFVIGYTGRGELVHAAVSVVLADVDLNQLLLQTHSTQFQLATPRPTPGLIPAVRLLSGSPVIGRFGEEVKPLTSQGVSPGGQCSSDPSRREPILFTHNVITGCTFSSPASDCSQLLSEIYGVLQGLAVPDVIAMNSGPQPDWTRVLTQECPVDPEVQETCETGCTVPLSLSVHILWARQGLIELPQNYILGARYHFQCEKVKCALSQPLTLTTTVTFADTTVYPEPPRGRPQPHWKFPFGFFTRGLTELDGPALGCSDAHNAKWSLPLLTVVLLAGL